MEDTLTYRGISIDIMDDDITESPRDWDNFGTMICKHSRYLLGDVEKSKEYKKKYGSIRDDMAMYFYLYHYDGRPLDHRENYYGGYLDEKGIDIVWMWIDRNVVLLELNLYDHGGITMSTGSFSCPWDSGQVGFIFVTKADILREFGGVYLTKALIGKSIKILESEVTTYDHYIRGDVYGFHIDEIGGSCYGFCGSDHEKSGLLENAHADIDWYYQNQMKNHVLYLKEKIKGRVPFLYRKPAPVVITAEA